MLPHKTTGTTEEEDILSHLVNIFASPQAFDQRKATTYVCANENLASVSRGHIFFAFDKMAVAHDKGNVIVILNDGHYQSEMTKAGGKLVVVDFTASW